MLFVSDYENLPEPTRIALIIIYLIFLLVNFLIGIIALIKSSKSEDRETKNFLAGISLLFILMGVSRIVFFYHDFFVSDEYDILFWKIANIFQLLGFLSFCYTFETTVYQKTKHAFTIGGTVFITLYVVLPDKALATLIMYIGTFWLFLLPGFIYVIMAIRSKGQMRRKVMMIIIGALICLLAAGTGFLNLFGLLDRTSALLIGPPMVLTGLVFIAYGLMKEESEEISTLVDSLYKSRPSTLTEEEVTFYREQKICLVCKGKVSRLMYLCPKCEALYCANCSEKLSDIENICWVCETPLDESKPVKRFKKEDETEEIEQDIKIAKKS